MLEFNILNKRKEVNQSVINILEKAESIINGNYRFIKPISDVFNTDDIKIDVRVDNTNKLITFNAYGLLLRIPLLFNDTNSTCTPYTIYTNSYFIVNYFAIYFGSLRYSNYEDLSPSKQTFIKIINAVKQKDISIMEKESLLALAQSLSNNPIYVDNVCNEEIEENLEAIENECVNIYEELFKEPYNG